MSSLSKLVGALVVVVFLVFGSHYFEVASILPADPFNELTAIYPDLVRIIIAGVAGSVIAVGIYYSFSDNGF